MLAPIASSLVRMLCVLCTATVNVSDLLTGQILLFIVHNPVVIRRWVLMVLEEIRSLGPLLGERKPLVPV